MDLSSDDRTAGVYSTRYGTNLEARPSFEARTPQTPPRLQKKRSTAGARTTAQSQAVQSVVQRQPNDTGDGNKARKGSLRNAVRKLFGRRSRDAEQTLQATPPKHGYHRSEPYTTTLATQPEVEDSAIRENEYARRTFSSPSVQLDLQPSFAVQRTRSPYAVEFPQSSRLKPLNLGDPYTAPGSQLKRRKTLPNVRPVEGPAAVSSVPVFQVDSGPTENAGDIGRALSTVAEKRRSRSASDLRQARAEKAISRKRSEEIRYWRESFQPSVLRASGFVVVPREDSPEQPNEEETTPMPRSDDPFGGQAGSFQGSPANKVLEPKLSDAVSPSALGSQLSQDIEDRVARLEAGLRSFRGELASLAADRNRRTVLIGGVPTPSMHRRASSGGRTASMLAQTLQTDLSPSNYNYDYTDTLRPSTSPQPPKTPPTRYAEPMPMNALSSHPPDMDDPFTSRPSPPLSSPRPDPARDIDPPSSFAPQLQQPQQYTFRSLYEMLADERSARRRLEVQMKGLRDEIANMHYQISTVSSNFQSPRSSYMDPQLGSSRLHALLRETEDSPPSLGQSGRHQPAGRPHPRVVSRFSGSESEVGGLAESMELETPYEAYQTPAEEGNFPFSNNDPQTRSGARNDGEMF